MAILLPEKAANTEHPRSATVGELAEAIWPVGLIVVRVVRWEGLLVWGSFNKEETRRWKNEMIKKRDDEETRRWRNEMMKKSTSRLRGRKKRSETLTYDFEFQNLNDFKKSQFKEDDSDDCLRSPCLWITKSAFNVSQSTRRPTERRLTSRTRIRIVCVR